MTNGNRVCKRDLAVDNAPNESIDMGENETLVLLEDKLVLLKLVAIRDVHGA